MKKKVLSWLLSVCLIVGLLPTAAFAEQYAVGQTESVVCADSGNCTGDTHAKDCPLYTVPDENTGEPADGGGELTAQEQLAALIAALPAPDAIDPEDEEQAAAVQGKLDLISQLLASSPDSGLTAEQEELLSAVAAALASAQPLETATDGELDLANGSIVITADGYTQGGDGTQTAYTGSYSITQTGSTAAANTITVTGGTHQITLNGVNIDVSAQTTLDTACAFAITGGDVTLNLAANSVNTLISGTVFGDATTGNVSFAGLWVKDGASLTVTGSGTLTAKGDPRTVAGAANSNTATGAGIGACGWGSPKGDYQDYYTVGTITIQSGVVNATGAVTTSGYGGPGIGGGSNASIITIEGGTVTAASGKTTGRGCAGIGGAYGYSGKKTVLISGGTVTATGNSAGIGGAAYAGNYDITISGGHVTAESTGVGAGIGHGGGDYGTGDNVGSITILGGEVNATGGYYAAGIGGGGCAAPAKGNYGAGGSGTIIIAGGAVTASGGQYAPGIGSGSYKENTKEATILQTSGAVGAITITGGTVTATNGTDFPGTSTGTSTAGTEYHLGATATGIGQGWNAGDSAKTDFSTWQLQTDFGDALALADSSAATALTRNGASFAPGQLVSSGTTYYILPEGYYPELTGDNGKGLLVTTDTAGTGSADLLITALDSISISGTVGADTIQRLANAETAYNGLSETLRCYVDQRVTEGHTLAELKEALKSHTISVTVTLDPNGGTVTSGGSTVIYGQTGYSFPVPTRPNYDFAGWYLNETAITGADGKGISAWDTISATTLTARWTSEIKGDGTAGAPYQIKSAANLIALSHISTGIGTTEEFALFGKTSAGGLDDTNIKALLGSCYDLTADVTLTTEDGFYGIGTDQVYYQTSSGWSTKWDYSFTGTFDGRDHTITLNVDTSQQISLSADPSLESDPFNGKVKLNDATYVIVSGGLFNKAGYANSGATIQNLKTAGTVTLVTKANSCGVLAGTTAGAVTIQSCQNHADLTVGSTFNVAGAAGFIGNATGTTLTITDCTNTGTMTAGAAVTLFDRSTTLSQGNGLAGGVTAALSAAKAVFQNCENTGAITATRSTELESRRAQAGGITGNVGTTQATFINCTNSGPIKADAQSGNYAGGLVGCTIETSDLTFTNCQNSAEVNAKNGGAAGMLLTGTAIWNNASFTDCFHVMTASNADGWRLSDSSASVSDGALRVPVTTEAANYFNETLYVVGPSGAKAADLFSADGATLYNDLTHNGNVLDSALPYQSWDDAFVIHSLADYENLVKAIEGDSAAQSAVLGSRLNGADTMTRSIALAKAYVKLNTDLTLTGTTAMGLGSNSVPFSGSLDGQGHIVTFLISSGEWSKTQPQYLGLIGNSAGASVKNVTFAGSVSIATAADNGNNLYVGPAVASGKDAVVSNCASTVRIEATHNTQVQNATGGYVYAGGLIGYQNDATVSFCIYTGAVTVTAPKYAKAGGIGGSLANAQVSNCTAKGDISAILRYNSSIPVFGEESAAGGIAGEMSGTVTDCTAAGEISASNDSPKNHSANAGGIAGLCTAELTITGSMALTTVTATRSGHTDNAAYTKQGALAGTPDKLNIQGTNWAVQTASISPVGGGNMLVLDATALDGGVFGEADTLYSGVLPDGIALNSDFAELDANTGTVTYTKAGAGTVSLTYEGKAFYTSGSLTVSPKPLADGDVTITGVNSAYATDSDAATALDTIQVVYGDTVLAKGADYAVTQDTSFHKFTIAFQGNYSGSADKIYQISAGAPAVTADGYSGVYDAQPHGITVHAPDGAAVTYGTSAVALSTSEITVTDAGTTTVYWKVESGNQTVTGSALIAITPAELTVTADDQTIYVGSALPAAYTYTVSGLAGSDTLTTAPTVTCTAKDASTVGTYPITPSNAGAGNNYVIRYVDGVLTVRTRSGSVPSSYTVSVDNSAAHHGSMSASPKNASAGTTVTITVKPDTGYELDELIVTDKSGRALRLTKQSDTQYTFIMPSGSVTVEASFVPETVSDLPSVSFTDVPADAYYAGAVAWAVENGITTGTGSATFSPDLGCTRAQMVTFLWRAAGSPKADGTNPFSDLDPGAYYYDAVLWAVEQGITSGTSATTFSPDDALTRGQTVTFLYRANGSPAVAGDSFADVSADAYYASAVTWAAAEGITSGVGNNAFAPDARCTRGQVVTFLYRSAV